VPRLWLPPRNQKHTLISNYEKDQTSNTARKYFHFLEWTQRLDLIGKRFKCSDHMGKPRAFCSARDRITTRNLKQDKPDCRIISRQRLVLKRIEPSMDDTLKNDRPAGAKVGVSILLSLCLGVFLADAGVSLLDDTLILAFGIHALAAIRGMVFFLSVLTGFLIYLLLGVSPMIPKRFFLPLALFSPVMMLVTIPLFIYHYGWFQQIAWVISFCQVIFVLGILYWILGGFRLRWPVVGVEQLGKKFFSWLNLSGFVLVNAFVLLPGVVLYLAFCAALALDHFTGSFLALHSDSLSMQARKYVRNDGKTIHLIPMMHIGESNFYDQISKSFPTNSVILMEGVTDSKNLLKHFS
jgi:hypothetical protein